MALNLKDDLLPKTVFYLDIDQEGQPKLSKEQIFSVNINAEIHFKLYNGTSITNDIKWISNTTSKFPSISYLQDIYTSSTYQANLEELEQYKINPYKINTIIYFKSYLPNPGLHTFAFAFINQETNKPEITAPFTILVNPWLDIGEDNKIPINKIQLQTVLSKNLGTLKNFDSYYKETSLLKYNFIHFTTINELSSSDSLYTIKNQTEISNSFFEKSNLSNEEKLSKFGENISKLKEEYHIGSVVDLILNQTSAESEWWINHPECGYNWENCPWLTVAYELDSILMEYSKLFSEKKVGCKSAPYINNENDLDETIEEIQKEINRSNWEEFFLIQIEQFYDQFKAFYTKNKEEDKDYAMKRSYLLNELKENFNIKTNNNDWQLWNEETLYDLISQSCTNYGASRFGVKIEVEFASMLILEASKEKDSITSRPNEYNFLKDVKRYINKINEDWTVKAKEMLKTALLNIREFIRYEFIQLKRTGVKRKWLDNYFHTFDKNDKSKIFLCNGWIMQSDDPNEEFPDITKYGTWYFLKRKVVIWSDTWKINYSTSIESCSKFLLDHITKYITQMASIFQGFVIDNILSVPIFALKYFIAKAKEWNPNLLWITQLPDGSLLNEVWYTNWLGINLFIKEMIWCTNPIEIADNWAKYGHSNNEIMTQCDKRCYEIVSNDENSNSLSFNPYYYLQPRSPNCLMYDLTQDNQAYYEQYNTISLNWSMMSCLGLLDCAVGSTRGYDQLFPFQPSVVKENRRYLYDDNFEDLLCEIKKNSEQKEKDKEIFFEFHPRNSEKPNARSVKLAMSHNDWIPKVSWTKINDNLFTARVKLPKGKYHYKYVLDDEVWTFDPAQPMEIDKKSKNVNNVLDWCDDTKLLAPDIKWLRRDWNNIRNELKPFDTEVYVHRDKDMICIVRLIMANSNNNTLPYDGYAVICRPGYDNNNNSISSHIIIPSEISDFVCGCFMTNPTIEINTILSEKELMGIKGNVYYTKDLNFLSSISNVSFSNGHTIIDFHSILPNTVVVLKLKMGDNVRTSVANLNTNIETIFNTGHELIEYYDMCDINTALFKCDKEEFDHTFNQRGIFKIDNYEGKLVYAGWNQWVQMWITYKKEKIIDNKNPWFEHIYKGDWFLEYILARISNIRSMKTWSKFIEDNIRSDYTILYPHLKPMFFDKIIECIYFSILKMAYLNIPNRILNFGDFSQKLSLARYQFIGHVLSNTFGYSLGPKQININPNDLKISVSAGLPNYSVDHLRFFSRDTFIAFNSLFLIPQLYNEGKTIIKMFGATLRHGLIPHVWDCGTKPRYNGRDCSWWFIKAINDYCSVTNDYNFLNEELEMVFLDDNPDINFKKKCKGEKRIMSIADIIQAILAAHAIGIDYREWNAGRELDKEMNNEGFNVSIHWDPATGFIYGGNMFNCGTWMNKIGVSNRGHNRTIPANSRNGANIEIVSLVYLALDFVIKMGSKGYYKYKSVSWKNGANYPLTEWKLLIKDNFEQSFYISRKGPYNKEHIYKDYLNEDKDKKHEYQWRPNIWLAILNTPELFTIDKIHRVIESIEKYWFDNSNKSKKITGIKSLDKEDTDYRGEYTPHENDDYLSSCGFNLHNGWEYVWLYGVYLLIKIKYSQWRSKDEKIRYISKNLIPLMNYIDNSDWMGLPEVIDEKGEVVKGVSCETHLISVAMIYEVINNIADE